MIVKQKNKNPCIEFLFTLYEKIRKAPISLDDCITACGTSINLLPK